MIVQGDATVTEWHHCYDDSWNGLIVDEAFAHPAKFAYGLITRIVKHGLAEGYWSSGSVVGDCFAGIGAGGIVCAANGMTWRGVELESRFVDLARRNFVLNPWCRNGEATIVQGDSRNFASLVGECAAVVTSAPFATGDSADAHSLTKRTDKSANFCRSHIGASGTQGYGESDGQLARFPTGSLAAVLTSPPYAESVKGEHGERETAADSRDARRTEGGSLGQSQRHGGYGGTDGQVGALPTGSLAAVLTSAPYAKSSLHGKDSNPERMMNGPCTPTSHGGGQTVYANPQSAGQVGALPEGRLDSVITSAPFGESLDGHGDRIDWSKAKDGGKKRTVGRAALGDGYGTKDGQLGNSTGDTYWSAVAAIYDQCRIALKPGGVLCCVMGNYVAKGKIVDLCGQTWTLLQHLGFEPLERIRALKTSTVEHDGLFEPVKKTKSRVSFFRRLSINRGSPDPGGEEVLFVRRP